jgi:hypothetical protein
MTMSSGRGQRLGFVGHERSTIVGAIGKPAPIKGYDLVLVIEVRLGPR